MASHDYHGTVFGRGARLHSKVADKVISLDRLEELLGKREPIPESKVAVSKPLRAREITH